MFKKRNTQKKFDVEKDLEQINVDCGQQELITIPKSIQSKKINKFSNQTRKESQEIQKQTKKPIAVKYGLIDKDEVNSKYHANLQDDEQQKQPEKHSLVNYYVKKKLDELVNRNEGKDKEKDSNLEEIMKMQKQYLQTGEQKLAEYDMTEILKKLQNMATLAIKNETQNRNFYLKNLLQNEHERMEYASKKQLKTIKQQKQRMEQEFKNKYNDTGRRGYVQKMKFSAMFGK